MVKAYIYSCYAHERQGTLINLISNDERRAFEVLASAEPRKHLDACQIRGCQEKRDRVIVVEIVQKQ